MGYVTTFASTLWTEYTYAWTQDVQAKVPINDWGTEHNPRLQILDSTVQYERGNYHARHDVPGHATFGFLFTGFLAFMRLRFTAWPLHPIGFLMVGTFPGAHLWLSFFVGWLAKTVIPRLAGPTLYGAAKPFFIGLIVGEPAAAGLWLVGGSS